MQLENCFTFVLQWLPLGFVYCFLAALGPNSIDYEGKHLIIYGGETAFMLLSCTQLSDTACTNTSYLRGQIYNHTFIRHPNGYYQELSRQLVKNCVIYTSSFFQLKYEVYAKSLQAMCIARTSLVLLRQVELSELNE